MGQYIGVPQATTREAGNSNTGHSGRRRPGLWTGSQSQEDGYPRFDKRWGGLCPKLRKGVHAPTSPHLLEGQRNLSSQG